MEEVALQVNAHYFMNETIKINLDGESLQPRLGVPCINQKVLPNFSPNKVQYTVFYQ